MDHVTTVECTLCGEQYDPSEVVYTCSNHAGVKGILEVQYDYDIIDERFNEPLDGRINTQWKYQAFLPVSEETDPITLGEGGTDLLKANRLGAELGVEIRVKDDGRNPTGVLKDRATSVSVTKAREFDRDIVTCASTGNAAASLAGFAARAGLECRIFVPGDAPGGKLAQPLVYGADVLGVEGTYDEAYDLSMEVTERFGWYNRNAAINPFQVEGKRTVGHELAEQCRNDIPDWVVFSMGDGCTIYGGWKGFHEFDELGYVDKTPKMLGVQAKGASAIHDMFHEHEDVNDVANTIADSIAVGRPRNTLKACKTLERSGGTSVLVSDEEILRAEALLGRTEGIYAEPAGAAPVAGVRKARDQGIIEEGESVVVVVTGNGLKDSDSAMQAGGKVEYIAPDIGDVTDRYRTNAESR
ncbi:threonine synthase [Haladaptatus caseinilyticus]|uniref:threonine synthase n=1 Tax=Haladaptatus caseinilyticus TaxID=2993314 RepID=UPI00224AC380|nr:threonine synthase [Haladaptatus caseinilyticus]